jgi:hypothetical protein
LPDSPLLLEVWDEPALVLRSSLPGSGELSSEREWALEVAELVVLPDFAFFWPEVVAPFFVSRLLF